MDLDAFRASLKRQEPPPGLARPLAALWHAARGRWDDAHRIAQEREGEPDFDWVHAYLHRVEGDLANAGYWYRRCKREPATGSLDAEWTAIAAALLAAS
jgi:hypothetical protein